MSVASRALAFAFAASLLAGCAAGASSAPPAGSNAPPTASPAPSSLAHATGSTDLVLRMETGGGFVPIGYLVSQAPTFSLYGDGSLVYRSPQSTEPTPLASPFSEVIRSALFRVGRLSEAEVQDLLSFALDTGGLRTARDSYDPGNVADAGSTIFTVDAGGVRKTVTIVALEIGAWPTDDPAIPKFLRLSDRLDALDIWGKLPGTYSPLRYRTVLTDLQVDQPVEVHPWPWPERKPADWTIPTDQQRPSFPSLVMTPAEVAAAGIPNPEGGYQNLILRAPDGKVYAFAVRPLLPDETS